MLPQVDIIYNYDYAKRLYGGQDNFENVWRKIIGLGADFEQVFDEYIILLLELVEKYTGFGWEEHAEGSFPIYLAEIEEPLAHPLTLPISDNPEKMLNDLVGQLVRRNMYFGFSDESFKKKCLESVKNHILREMNIKKEIEKGEIDLSNLTIKDYLKANI